MSSPHCSAASSTGIVCDAAAASSSLNAGSFAAAAIVTKEALILRQARAGSRRVEGEEGARTSGEIQKGNTSSRLKKRV